jgi:hypothetical protein
MSCKSCKKLRARPRQQILKSLYTTTLATSTRKLSTAAKAPSVL